MTERPDVQADELRLTAEEFDHMMRQALGVKPQEEPHSTPRRRKPKAHPKPPKT